MNRALSSSFVLCLVLLGGAGGCAPAADNTDSAEAELSNRTIDGDRVVAEAAAVLGADRNVSVRYALDRAIAKVGGYNVEAAPSVICNGGPEQTWWNGQDAALSRLGMVGLANIVALEAVTSTWTHVALLSNAAGSNAEAAKALAILRDTESPALVLSALSALASNPSVSESGVRALLALEMDVYETKRVRADDGSLRLPDLSNPPSAPALLDRLRRSPASSYRAFAARIWSRWAGGTTAADVDSLLSDRDYAVRVAAAPLFWKSSQPSTASAKAFIDWFSGQEAHGQLRAAVLRTRYGLSVDQATAFADEPDGFAELLETTRAEVVGGMLTGATPNSDIRSLLAAAASFRRITGIVDDAARAVNASTVLSTAEKKSAVLALLPAAEALQWDNVEAPFANLWRTLGKEIVSSPATDDVLVAYQRAIFLPDAVDKAALSTKLKSPERQQRIEAIQTIAITQSGFASALFDVGLGTDAMLARAKASTLLAALENGASAKAVAERVLGLASSSFPGQEPTIEFWDSQGLTWFEVLARAVESTSLSNIDRRDVLVRFANVVSPINTTAAMAPGPSGVNGSSYIARVFRAITLLAPADRVGTWRNILARPDGRIRDHLLPFAPTDASTTAMMARLLRPALIYKAETCWGGQVNPATQRDALSIVRALYVVAPPKNGVVAGNIVAARIQTLKNESANGEDLGPVPTYDLVWQKRPDAKDRWYGKWADEALVRARWESSSENLVARIIASQDDRDRDELVLALGNAVDYDALPEARLSEVEAALTAANRSEPERAKQLFFLRVSRGTSYDALAARFRGKAALRWDLADAARPRGERAALETLLGSTGAEFGLPSSSVGVAVNAILRADVGQTFREGLGELIASGWNFWSNGPAGQMPMARARGNSLDWVARGFALRARPGPGWSTTGTFALFGSIAKDQRLSASAATRLAWTAMASPPTDESARSAYETRATDLVVALGARTDVPLDERRALGRALLQVVKK